MKNTFFADGWKHFLVDLERQPEFTRNQMASYQQAYKNGGAAVIARTVHRGQGELTRMLGDEILATKLLAEWAIICRHAHPDWSQLHDDSIIAGGFSALICFRAGDSVNEVSKQISAFTVKG
jgi:hypothetical protein